MAERDSSKRSPDESPLGDANIPDFLAQQQGAADLTDFALQSNAGANLIAGAQTVDPGLAAPIDQAARVDTTVVSALNGTTGVTLNDSNADPLGTADNIFFLATGGFTVFNVDFGTFTIAPGTTAIQVTGGIQYFNFLSSPMADFIPTLVFYDDLGNPLGDSGVMGAAQAYRILGTEGQSSPWHHISVFCSVPVGATQVGLMIWGYNNSAFHSSDAVRFNSLRVQAASQIIGIEGGRISERAAWWLPWGEVTRIVNSTNQTVASTVETSVTQIGSTFSAIAGRQYRIRVIFNVRDLSPGSHLTIKIKVDGALVGPGIVYALQGTANRDYCFSKDAYPGSLTTTTHSWTVTCQSDNAAGWTSLVPSTVTIDDVGPVVAQDGGSLVWPVEAFAAG